MEKTNSTEENQNHSTKKLICENHNKQIEGYCKDCLCYVCANCMFESPNIHKNHNFLSLDELSFYLREKIDKNSDLLKHDYCDKPLMNIRQCKTTLTQNTNTLIERINKESDKLIEIIKTRREQLIKTIKSNLENEIKTLTNFEEKWKQKLQVSQQLIKLSTNKNDQVVYSNLLTILRGIELLREGQKMHSYKQFADYDNNIKVNAVINNKQGPVLIKLSMDELIDTLNNMFVINDKDAVNMEFRA
jgi:hypothetical protein